MKRVLSLLLVFSMLFGMMPLAAFATETAETTAEEPQSQETAAASEGSGETGFPYEEARARLGDMLAGMMALTAPDAESDTEEPETPETTETAAAETEGQQVAAVSEDLDETEQTDAANEEAPADFDYIVDESAQTITLTKYIGSDAAVVVADSYTVGGKVYATVLDSSSVFRYNSAITSVVIGSGVGFKDNSMAYLFSECKKLVSVDMTGVDTSEITSMAYLFDWCSKLTTVTGYENWDTGKVKSIYKAFNRNNSIATVDLSSWDLSSVVNSGWCFQQCYATEIKLPDNLKTISAGFLNHASKVTGSSFTIPAGVEKIGYAHTIYDFATDDFVEFIVAEGNEHYVAIDGILYSADGTEMLAVPRNKTFENNTYEIPEGVAFLGELSFSRNYNIHTLVLPDSYVIEYVPLNDARYIVFEDIGNINTGTNLSIAIYCYTGITEYAVKDSNPNYASLDGIIYSKDMTEVVAIPARYAQEMVIPEGVTAWNREAMWADTDNNSSSTLIGLLANCPGVSIPASLKEMDQGQMDMLNLLYTSRKGTTDPFTITVAEGNTAFALDETEGLVVKAHEHTYENGVCTGCGEEHPSRANYEDKVISILGDSISTFAGYIPTADGFNLEHYARYPQDNLFTDVEHTWWMQVLTALDAKLGINESWRSTEVGNIYDVEVNSGYEGTKACMASLTRIQNLGSNGTPDVILFYGGTNDITQRRTVGTFDPATAPTEVDLTSVKWDTVAEAYVAAIMRMQYYYPDAQIIAMLPTFTYKNTDAVIEEYNSVFAAICEHYGVTYIDLRDCGITTSDLPDGTHPDETGMDYITAAVLDILLTDCEVEAGEHTVHSVTHNLTGAESSLSYYKGVSHGKSFVTAISGEELTVTVTMGGVDISADCYANSVVSIESVTGDVVITATGKEKTVYDDHLQQLPDDLCSGLNLWTALEPENSYYTTTGWGNLSTGQVWSITIPVTAGDRIYANSFEKNGSNGNNYNSTSGIRVTYFDAEGVYKSLSPNEVYAEFAANGYLTIPEGVVAVCIPMWTNTDENVVYILSAEHTYENGICTGCGEVTAMAGKKLSILGASISTYTGISNNAEYNSTIGSNVVYYTEGRYDVYANDTWWMQAANDLGLELLVNNSWSGSSLLYERSGTVGAYVDRCVQLHNNDGENPDIIAIQMGTNDFQYYKDTLGTADIDYAALIALNDDGSYTYAEPTTSLEAAAIVLHKISVRYPNAEVYYLNISQRVDNTDALIQSFNAELKKVVNHFGAHIVDIYGSAITMAEFDTYIGDGRVHPNALGMDAYTEAFKRSVIANTNYQVTTHTVSLDLENVTADYGDDKIVVSGDAFRVNLTAADSLNVTVTMGGEDITASAYANGTVSIAAVTGDVTITATSVYTPRSYRWEFDGTELACVKGSNALTKNGGTTTDGVFSNTMYALDTAVVLKHDLPWTVEWKCEGTFQNSGSSSGARIFTSTDVNAEYNARYIFKSNKNGLIAMGEKTTSGSHNYGIALGDHNIDWTAEHTYRLENRIADDGSNMVYLWVDGVQIGAMNHYYVGTTDKNTTSDWLSGKDFVFPYMGTDTHGFTNASIDYIQIWESGHTHTYENGTCIECGHRNGPVITRQPESVQAALGEKFSVTVEAQGEGLTYQWYYKNKNSESFTVSTFKRNSYSMTMATYCHNREIYCVITDANGNSVQTETVLITAPLTITKQPTDVQVEIGERFSVSVSALGDGLTYQWYYKSRSSDEFVLSCFKGKTYSMTMREYCHERQVYCVITDAYGNTVTTDTVTITRPPVALVILSQPQDVQVEIGQRAEITVAVQGEGLTYQWYYKNRTADEFAKSGFTGDTYAMIMREYCHNRQVYCVITDQYGSSVTTEIATMSRPPVELKILEQPADVYAAKGEKFSVSFTVQGEGLTYQWYYKPAGAKEFKVSSFNGSTYSMTMAGFQNGRQVYCVITDQYGSQVTTETATIILS